MSYKKSVACNIRENKQESGVFTGYASVFGNKDFQGDIIREGAFRRSIELWEGGIKNIYILWQHDVKNPIGKLLDIKEDQHGLWVKIKLCDDTQLGTEAYNLLKSKVIKELSIGFNCIRAKNITTGKQRAVLEADLREISLVTFAANSEAKVCRVS